MKTIVIWNTFDYGLKFFVVEGDLRKFHNVYVGVVDNQELQEELAQLMWDEEGNNRPLSEYEDFPVDVILDNRPGSVFVIECGIIP
jgi:hypothetical protein